MLFSHFLMILLASIWIISKYTEFVTIFDDRLTQYLNFAIPAFFTLLDYLANIDSSMSFAANKLSIIFLA